MLTKKDFDDLVTEPYGSVWSQCCSNHVKQCGAFNRSDNALDTICGVRGCNEIADYYVDFSPNLDTLNESCAPDGWCVMYNTEQDRLEIQKVDDVNCFFSDEDAIEYVVNQFLRYPKGSAYHIAIEACIDSDPKLQPFCGLDEMTLFYVQNRLDVFSEKTYSLHVQQECPQTGLNIFKGFGALFLEFPVPCEHTKSDWLTNTFTHETTPLTALCKANEHFDEYNFDINGQKLNLSRHELYELKRFINSIPV